MESVKGDARAELWHMLEATENELSLARHNVERLEYETTILREALRYED